MKVKLRRKVTRYFWRHKGKDPVKLIVGGYEGGYVWKEGHWFKASEQPVLEWAEFFGVKEYTFEELKKKIPDLTP